MIRYLKTSKSRLDKLMMDPFALWIMWMVTDGEREFTYKGIKAAFRHHDFDVRISLAFLSGKNGGHKFIDYVTTDNGFKVTKVVSPIAKAIQNKKVKDIPEEYQYLFELDEFRESWDNWCEVRKKKKTAMTPRSHKMHLKKLVELSKGKVQMMIKMMDRSAAKGWTEVYEPDDEMKKEKSNNVSMTPYPD